MDSRYPGLPFTKARAGRMQDSSKNKRI